MFDGLDEQDEVDAAWFDVGVAQRRLMNLDAAIGGNLGGTGIGLDALEGPAALAETAEEVEVDIQLVVVEQAVAQVELR